MSFNPPAVTDFKAQFVRDFPFVPPNGDQSQLEKYVVDQDVTNAIIEAGLFGLPCDGFGTQTNFTYAYCMLAAHFLSTAIASSSQGLRGRGGEWAQVSRSIGNVSASFALPDRFKNSPLYAPLLQTTYGCRYLNLLAPELIGGAFAVAGMSKP